MKKIIFGLSLAGLFMGCQKPPKGGNHSVLRLNNVSAEGFPYSADAQGVRGHELPSAGTDNSGNAVVATDSTKMPDMKEVASPNDHTKSPQMDVE